MRFERTFNKSLIYNTITHPRLWPHISDDFSPDPKDYEPPLNPHVFYIAAWDGLDFLGLWILHPHNFICYEIHTCLLPKAWGQKALQAAREVAPWIFANTPARRLVTNVPRYNRLALRFAKEAGMKQFGVNEKSFQKKGQLHDQIMLGLSEN